MRVGLLLAIAWIGLCRGLFAEQVTVFAASSLSEALQAIAPGFTAQTGHTVRFSFGASGTLARQIREGAPADVFISADQARAIALDEAGLTVPATRQVIAENLLVLVVANDSSLHPASLDALIDTAHVRCAVGDPATVPAGTYTKAYLEQTGAWKRLAGRLIPTGSVRAAISAVETGQVDAAFVYRTDALGSPRVREVLDFAPPTGPRVVYPAVLLRRSPVPEAAAAWLAWLHTAEAQGVLQRFGFLPPAP